MVDIMSLTKMGGQVALTVTPEDLHHFANALLAQSRKEWEEQAASARKEESEETFLTTEDVCKIFNVCPATLWQWHRTGYLQHIKFGNGRVKWTRTCLMLTTTIVKRAYDVYRTHEPALAFCFVVANASE